jgi:hypothetical protein
MRESLVEKNWFGNGFGNDWAQGRFLCDPEGILLEF